MSETTQTNPNTGVFCEICGTFVAAWHESYGRVYCLECGTIARLRYFDRPILRKLSMKKVA